MHSSCDGVIGNMDLVMEILLRLPVKHVLRCKCVCKKWMALVSDPLFRYSHTHRLCHNPYPCSLLLQKLEDMYEFKAHIVPFTNGDDADPSPTRIIHLSFYAPGWTFSVVQSCNGLLLGYRSFSVGLRFPRRYSYKVCNPATNHYVHIDYPSDKHYRYSRMPYLAFEPLRSPHYKVILFNEVNGSDHDEWRWATTNKTFDPTIDIGVYSSETGSWSEVRVCCSAPPNIFDKSGVYCNGAIHWYTLGEDLVYFDIHHLGFNKLFGPASVDSNDACVKYFGESGGDLHLILANSDESLDFDIWKLKENYSGWVVIYHVDLNLMGEGDAFLWHANPSFSVLCVARQANEEDSMLVLFVDSKIISYNLKDHTSRTLREVDEMSHKSFQYFETFSCAGLDYRSGGTLHFVD